MMMMIEPYFRDDLIDVTIYHADCREVLKMLADTDVQAVITDPPYGLDFRTKSYATSDNENAGEFADGEDIVRTVSIPVIEECRRKFGRVVLTPGTKNMWMYNRPDEIGCFYCRAGVGCSCWGFRHMHPILYYGKDPYLTSGEGARPNSFSGIELSEPVDHPCSKPLGWMRWLVNRASLSDETVLDPFLGSGSTGIAAIELGRKFIGVEMDRRYVDLAVRRIQPVCRYAASKRLGAGVVAGRRGLVF
jgi:DNA modification methylase